MRIKKKIAHVKVCYTIKMNKLTVSILALFLWSPSIQAMTVQTLIDLHEGDDLDKQIVYVAMHNAGEAAAWTNTFFESRHKVKLFCHSPRLNYSGKEYYQLMIEAYYYGKGAGVYTDENGPHMVGPVLIAALSKEYPCD